MLDAGADIATVQKRMGQLTPLPRPPHRVGWDVPDRGGDQRIVQGRETGDGGVGNRIPRHPSSNKGLGRQARGIVIHRHIYEMGIPMTHIVFPSRYPFSAKVNWDASPKEIPAILNMLKKP